MMVSNPGRARNFSCIKRSRPTTELNQPPIQWILGCHSQGQSGQVVKLTTHLHLVRRLMSGALTPLPLYAFVAVVEPNLSQHCFVGLSETTKDLSKDVKGRPSDYQEGY